MKNIHLIMAFILILIHTSCLQNEENLNEAFSITNSTAATLKSDSVLVSETIQEHFPVATRPDVSDSSKYIYITIDDAPMRGTQYIDSVIQAKKVKTSIFFVGAMTKGSKTFKKNYEQLSQNPYVESCNHSYSHANHKYNSFYKEPEKVLEDMNLNEAELQLNNQIVRLPGRNTWQLGERKRSESKETAKAAELLAENGYKIYGWDIEWGYEKDGTPKQTVDKLVEEIEEAYSKSRTFTKNHVIVLMHDQMFKTIHDNKSLHELIDKLAENNYTFRYLREYPEQDNI